MRRSNTTLFTTVIAVLAVLFTAALTAAIVFTVRFGNSEKENNEISSLRLAESDSAAIKLDEMNSRLSELVSERDSLNDDVAGLESEQAALIESFNDADERYKKLGEEIARLEGIISGKQNEIDELKSDIAKLERVYMVDINAQFEIIRKLETLLAEGAPMKTVPTAETDADGAEITEEVYPRIALYYEDIERGFTYSYNDDLVFYTASCLKAPFVLSILQAATEEEAKIAAAIEAGETPPERIYNFDETYTYYKTDEMSGSGIIKDEPDGTVYTYRQLIELLLVNSDNVAFDQLKKKYGTAGFHSLAWQMNTTAMKNDLATMTASDGGKSMKAIYSFMESDSPYAKLMYDAMTTSIHRVLIPYAVAPRVVAHKYGWDTDAYHDTAIVYDENPYVVTILTDLDKGGDEVNEYIREIIKLVDELHKNFYKQR